MTDKIQKVLRYILFVIIILFIADLLYKSNTKINQYQNEFKKDQALIILSQQREMVYAEALKLSATKRAVAERRYDSLVRAFAVLNNTHTKTVQQLSQTRTMFNNLSSKQLSSKMVDEYNKSLK
jgi:hypothetical protein